MECRQVGSPILVLEKTGDRRDFKDRINIQKYLQGKACLQGHLEFGRIRAGKLVIWSKQRVVDARTSFEKPSRKFHVIIK